MNITCPNCGAPLVYDVETAQMKCSYCDQNTNRTGSNTPQINAAADETTTVSSHVTPDMDNMEMNLYHCSSCGADLLAGKTQAATFCSYCGSPSIVFERVSKEAKPNKIIPFKLTEHQALNCIKAM